MMNPNNIPAVSRSEVFPRLLDHTLGHIRGKVVDIDGRPIPECKIWIRETGKSTYSDEHGDFAMINIPPALYTVIVECEDYALCISPDLPVSLGDNPGLRFVMHLLQVPKGMYLQFDATRLAFQA
jgi:hypothetical protein